MKTKTGAIRRRLDFRSKSDLDSTVIDKLITNYFEL